jgi:1-acyl-sn-glycerol-3-phosphate acyltransferase
MKLVYWLRSFVATIWLVFFTGVIATSVMFCGLILKNQRYIDWLIHIWGRSLTWFFNIHVEVRGLENLPSEGCLLLFNHSSNFDIMIFAASIPKHARFGAKIELFKIPIFGQAMRAAGVLPIARAEREKVLNLYSESIEKVQQGTSFVLAAEGTRQPTPGVGAKFKAGPFIFAITGQFPIVPVVIRGAAEIQPKGELLACTKVWRSHATITVLPPVPTKGFSIDDRTQLQEQIRIQMTNAYQNG